jgi:hypothetical protein
MSSSADVDIVAATVRAPIAKRRRWEAARQVLATFEP